MFVLCKKLTLSINLFVCFLFAFFLTSLFCESTSALTEPGGDYVVYSYRPILQAYGRVCSRYIDTTYGEKFGNCDRSYWVPATITGSVDNGSFTYYDVSLNVSDWFYSGNDKYFIINRFQLGFSSNTLDFQPINDGDYVWSFIGSNEHNIYLGNANPFSSNDSGRNLFLYQGGLNSYITGSYWNNVYSCLDFQPDCNLRFSWDTDTGFGAHFVNSFKFIKPSSWNNIGFNSINIMNNYYDRVGSDFLWSFMDENVPLMVIPYFNNNATFNFRVAIVKTSELIQLSESDGVNPDSLLGVFEEEQKVIRDDLASALSLFTSLDLNFNVINPLQPIINAFTDLTCYDFVYLPAMFNAGSTRICSPWLNIRPFITPVAVIMFNLVLFRFIITWFKRGES